MYKIIECEQGTDAWFQARLGKITASNFDKIITKTGKLSASSEEVINKAVAEIILGKPDEFYRSEAMERGNELEEQALKFFNFSYGYDFKATGFLESENGGYGCSPDAIDLENKIGLELKCPMAHTHIGYLAGNELPKKYYQQVQGCLMVTGFKKWVFGSYHPEMKGLHVVVERDEKFIEEMRKQIEICVKKIAERYEQLKLMKAA